MYIQLFGLVPVAILFKLLRYARKNILCIGLHFIQKQQCQYQGGGSFYVVEYFHGYGQNDGFIFVPRTVQSTQDGVATI